MNQIEIGWLAGIIDGEGSIVMDKRTMWRHPTISISSTDIEILLEVKRICGAGSILRHKKYQTHHKDSWIFRLYGAGKVLGVLALISPFLKCPQKKRRADFLLSEYPSVSSRNGFYTDEQKTRKKDFETRFFEL